MEQYENYIKTKYGYGFYAFEFNGKEYVNAIIYNLYVYQEYRRQGRATDILLKIIRLIRGFGYEGNIEIEAEPREGSISAEDLERFYQRLGLIIVHDNKYTPEKIEKNVRVPISAAKGLSDTYGYPEIVIFAYDPASARQHVTTYGETKENSIEATKIGNYLKKALGWPEEG